MFSSIAFLDVTLLRMALDGVTGVEVEIAATEPTPF